MLSLLLCMMLLLSCVGIFAACGDKEEGFEEESTEEGSVADSGTEAPPPELVKLIEDGKSEYVVVYPNDAPSVIVTAVDNFITKVHEATGVKLTKKSDYIRPNQTYDPSSKEILIGKTNREETKQVLGSIRGSDSYVIKQVGAKIVILSPNDTYTFVAVNYFARNLLESNMETDEATGAKTLYFEEYEFIDEASDKDGKTVKYLGGREIFDYTIVYETAREGYQRVAEELQNMLADATGHMLAVTPDNGAKESECEILIGKTNRSFSKSCYERESADLMRYEVAFEGTKLQIISGGPFSAKQCVDDMRFSVFSSDAEELTEGYHFDTKLTTPTALTSGTDLRIMTYNVLVEAWATDAYGEDRPYIPQRAEIFAALLRDYTPDAIGLQECCDEWVKHIKFYLELLEKDYDLEYSFVWDLYNTRPNYTPILYRSDKFTVADSGFQVSSIEGNPAYYLRVYAWAKFQEQGGTEQFMMLNTHWTPWNDDTDDLMAAEEAQLLEELMAAHTDVPIFLTADYNENMAGNDNGTVLPKFVEDTGVTVAKLVAKDAGTLVNDGSGCGDLGARRGGGNTIDFILVSPGCEYDVLRYEVILHNKTEFCSDHSPWVGDFRWK